MGRKTELCLYIGFVIVSMAVLAFSYIGKPECQRDLTVLNNTIHECPEEVEEKP